MKFSVINSFTVVGFSIVLLVLLSATALQRNAQANATPGAETCANSLQCPLYTAQASIGALLR